MVLIYPQMHNSMASRSTEVALQRSCRSILSSQTEAVSNGGNSAHKERPIFSTQRANEAEALDRNLARFGGMAIILVQIDGVAVVDCRFASLPAPMAASRIERRLRERYRSDIRFRLDLYRRLRADGRVFVTVAVRAPVEPTEPEGADWQPLGDVAATIVSNLARIPRASL